MVMGKMVQDYNMRLQTGSGFSDDVPGAAPVAVANDKQFVGSKGTFLTAELPAGKLPRGARTRRAL